MSEPTPASVRQLRLRVNGQVHDVEAEPAMPLLWVLRERLGLLGTKFGCGIGQCGACTVLRDGVAIRSCLTPVASTQGAEITTIEGLGDGDHPLQRAWIEGNVAQCGYCQSGQIMSACALLRANPSPSEEQIRSHMAGNICRCGTYGRILRAIQRASRMLADEEPSA